MNTFNFQRFLNVARWDIAINRTLDAIARGQKRAVSEQIEIVQKREHELVHSPPGICGIDVAVLVELFAVRGGGVGITRGGEIFV